MAKANKPPATAEGAEGNDPGADAVLDQLRADLAAAKAEAEQLRAERDKAVAELESSKADQVKRDAEHQARIGQLESEIERLRGHLTDLSAECERLTKAAAPAPAPEPAAPVVSGTRRARVSIPGTHVAPIDVTIPCDTKDHTTAAIEAAKRAMGIVAFGAGPQVEFLD
ncbi:MAG TPA: hypothetical protein VGE74_28210 [Gemmata sp.]